MKPDWFSELERLESLATPGPVKMQSSKFASREELAAELYHMVINTEKPELCLHSIVVEKPDGLNVRDGVLIVATTGCGPTSQANSDFLMALRNAWPEIRKLISEQPR